MAGGEVLISIESATSSMNPRGNLVMTATTQWPCFRPDAAGSNTSMRRFVNLVSTLYRKTTQYTSRTETTKFSETWNVRLARQGESRGWLPDDV